MRKSPLKAPLLNLLAVKSIALIALLDKIHKTPMQVFVFFFFPLDPLFSNVFTSMWWSFSDGRFRWLEEVKCINEKADLISLTLGALTLAHVIFAEV